MTIRFRRSLRTALVVVGILALMAGILERRGFVLGSTPASAFASRPVTGRSSTTSPSTSPVVVRAPKRQVTT